MPKSAKQPGKGLKYDTIAKASATGGLEPPKPSEHVKPPMVDTAPMAPTILKEVPTRAPIPG